MQRLQNTSIKSFRFLPNPLNETSSFVINLKIQVEIAAFPFISGWRILFSHVVPILA